MNLDLIITWLKANASVFHGNVAGAAAYASAVNDQVWLPAPAAYVIPLAQEAGDNQSQTGLYQIVTESVGVIVAMDNSVDRRGQTAVTTLDQIQAALFAALLNWRPDSTADNPVPAQAGNWQADHESRGLFFAGGRLVDFDRARLFYQFDFGLEVTITQEDGWQAQGVPLTDIQGTITDANTGETLATFDAPISQP